MGVFEIGVLYSDGFDDVDLVELLVEGADDDLVLDHGDYEAHYCDCGYQDIVVGPLFKIYS